MTQHTLAELLLKETTVTDDTFEYLLQENADMKRSTTLKKVNLSGCQHISDKGLQCLILWCPNLQELDISSKHKGYARIGDTTLAR